MPIHFDFFNGIMIFRKTRIIIKSGMYRKFIVYVHVQYTVYSYTRFKTQIALIIGMRSSASNTRTKEEKGGLTTVHFVI